MLIPEEDILSVALWEWFVREPRMEDWTDEERLALSAGWWSTVARIREGFGHALFGASDEEIALLLARGEAIRRRARLGSWEAVLRYTERALEVERAEAEILGAVCGGRWWQGATFAGAVDRLRLARRELERAGRR